MGNGEAELPASARYSSERVRAAAWRCQARWVCFAFGFVQNRDVDAANKILAAGLGKPIL